MKATLFLALVVAAEALSLEARSGVNPLDKVFQLMDELTAKIVKEGEVEQKAYEEYVEWCDDASKSKIYEIKTLKAKKEGLEALIDKLAADIAGATDEIEKLTGSIATDEAELKDATLIREKENKEFVAAEGELMDGIDTIGRAIGILEREMAKNPAFLQTVNMSSVQKLISSISAILDAAAFSLPDQKKLLALVQQARGGQGQGDEAKAEEDEAALEGNLGAPASKTYESHSSGIVDVLEDMKEKAEGELSDLRKAESAAQHNFDMLRQALTDQIAADTKDLEDAKTFKAECEESKSTAEGDLVGTVKDLADAEKVLATAQSTCMTVAADHAATVASRSEELKVIAEAKKIVQDATSGAESQTYSFLQIESFSKLKSQADLAKLEVISLIKKLAKQHHSLALSQLASKINAVMRFDAASGDDPFVKVKGLIQELIDKLVAEGEAEAKEHGFCEAEMAKTEAKKAEIEEDIAKLTSKIDKAAAASAKLKAEVKELQAELAALAKTQMEMDKIRHEQHEDYLQAKSDLTQGLEGVRKALGVLREYYGGAFVQQPPLPKTHEKASGAGSSIIGILEVCESDFAHGLAKEESTEADAEEEYQKITQENKVTKTLKTQDVKYKTGDYKGKDKAIAELSSDKETEETELGAVLEYYAKLKDRCIAKPETYEERKRRREAEIAGLKDALNILENETVEMKASMLQRQRHGLRGAGRW
jgi:hypothetical protein